tara:strand:- start:694 stop:828 length:135 start_codon:yes stop_codon:yes gene_type:complete
LAYNTLYLNFATMSFRDGYNKRQTQACSTPIAVLLFLHMGESLE